jgi:outer membrane protein assembly factor BamB
LAGVAIEGDRAYFGSIGRRVWAIDWRSTTYPLERALLFWKTNLFLWGVLSKPPVQKGTLWSTRVGGDVLHTPALAHDTVYAAAAKGEVVALAAATGAKRWATDLGVKITAAPIVAGESVLIGTETGSVFGLDAHTGKVLWDFKTEDRITGSPIVVGDTMYVVSHDGKLYAVSS